MEAPLFSVNLEAPTTFLQHQLMSALLNGLKHDSGKISRGEFVQKCDVLNDLALQKIS